MGNIMGVIAIILIMSLHEYTPSRFIKTSEETETNYLDKKTARNQPVTNARRSNKEYILPVRFEKDKAENGFKEDAEKKTVDLTDDSTEEKIDIGTEGHHVTNTQESIVNYSSESTSTRTQQTKTRSSTPNDNKKKKSKGDKTSDGETIKKKKQNKDKATKSSKPDDDLAPNGPDSESPGKPDKPDTEPPENPDKPDPGSHGNPGELEQDSIEEPGDPAPPEDDD
ncbi:hypothetical protein [Lentibacillus salicampi]|uniref:Uncharacterized protein n=1 Tax=Lentibacillus salicampi TaxID=175306 RepID=A0A4Y9A8J4_9BACI|nr:hypothetical protein [Lentibacillus salicampi]TFJ91572.1 hypothetical protein E4U82_16955 [Lentibacillus salicampi]